MTISKDNRERRKTRREKLAGYFHDLSKPSFAAMALGGLTPLLVNEVEFTNCKPIGFGSAMTFIFGYTANRTVKRYDYGGA